MSMDTSMDMKIERITELNHIIWCLQTYGGLPVLDSQIYFRNILCVLHSELGYGDENV